jgi:hypothetical protein
MRYILSFNESKSFSKKSFYDLVKNDDILSYLLDLTDREIISIKKYKYHEYGNYLLYKNFMHYKDLFDDDVYSDIIYQNKKTLNEKFFIFTFEIDYPKNVTISTNLDIKSFIISFIKTPLLRIVEEYDVNIFININDVNFYKNPMARVDIIIQSKNDD